MAEPTVRRRRSLRDESGIASRRSSTAVLVLLLCQAQGLVMAPAFFPQHHHNHGGGSTQRAPTAAAPVALSHPTSNRRRYHGWSGSAGWHEGASRRSWNNAASSSQGYGGRLRMMANPEGTQQLRDRDLEFMFYDEAQVCEVLLPQLLLLPQAYRWLVKFSQVLI